MTDGCGGTLCNKDNDFKITLFKPYIMLQALKGFSVQLLSVTCVVDVIEKKTHPTSEEKPYQNTALEN